MKRGRLDVGISKEEHDASENSTLFQEDSEVILFPYASEYALKSRKIYSKVTTREDEYHRHLFALNKAFVISLDAQKSHNEHGDWSENMREYIRFSREIESKFGSGRGKVFTFGSGDCGQLAHGVEEDEDMMVKFPRIVRSLQNKNILRVACGGLHSAAITQDGEVFTWGCNDDGALGRGGEENLPAKVNGFESGSCIVDVVAGDCHTAVVALSGHVYSWGSYKDKEGKLWCDSSLAKSSFKEKQMRPFQMKSLTNVVDLSCGSTFNIARTNDGKVYSWGLGEMGQLGRKVIKDLKNTDGNYFVENVFREHLTPSLMTLDSEELPPVKAIGCGSYHTLLALSSNGYLYACGLNNYGQLGIGSVENFWDLHLVQDLSGKNIVQVAGGTHHSLVLTNDGEVYSFGRADSGQLGMMDVCQTGDFKDRPQHVIFDDSDVNIRSISCGSNHSIVLSESNDIYTWGYGDMLALGNGREQDEKKPFKIDWKRSGFGDADIIQVDAGGQHSAVLAARK